MTQPADTLREHQAPEPVPMSPALRELIRLLARAAMKRPLPPPPPAG